MYLKQLDAVTYRQQPIVRALPSQGGRPPLADTEVLVEGVDAGGDVYELGVDAGRLLLQRVHLVLHEADGGFLDLPHLLVAAELQLPL